MGFGDYADAMQFRDLIKSMVQQEMDQARPTPTYARVYSIDTATRSCMVVMTGDVTPVKAVYGSIIPAAVDQIVRLEGPPGARYIADVLGDNSSDVGLSSVTKQVDVLRHNTRMQENLIGGGNRQVSASGVAWTEAFYVISTGRNASLQAAAFYSINMPTSGTVVGVGGAASRSFSAAGVTLNDWEALYVIIPTISNNATLSVNDLRIVSYTADYTMPENAVLLAIRSGGTGKPVTWGDGTRMVPNESSLGYFCDVRLNADTALLGAGDAVASGGWVAANDTGGLFRSSATSGTGSPFARLILPVGGRWDFQFQAYLDLGASGYGACKIMLNGRTPGSNSIASDHQAGWGGAFAVAGVHVHLDAFVSDTFAAGDVIYFSVWSDQSYRVKRSVLGNVKSRLLARSQPIS